MAKLKVGDKAPDFKAVDGDGKTHSLGGLKGKTVVIFFYPRDLTPGCTREACDFQSAWAGLKKRGILVFGISGDSAVSHGKFAAKHGLEFPLLVDEGHAITKAYGAWGDKMMYGKKFKGVIRSTFVIGGDGRIAAIYSKVKVDGHVEAVIEGLG